MKRLVLSLFCAALLLVMTVPAIVAESGQEAGITWLFTLNDRNSIDDISLYYVKELDQFSFVDPEGRDKTCGMADRRKEINIYDYDCVYPFSDGVARVIKAAANGSWKYGYIDESGKKVIDLKYTDARDFTNGLALVAQRFPDEGPKYGFIDKTGQTIISFEYDAAEEFSNGLALVAKADADGALKAI